MKNFLRRLLGLDALENQLDYVIAKQRQNHDSMLGGFEITHKAMHVQTEAIGKILVQVHPLLAVPEQQPTAGQRRLDTDLGHIKLHLASEAKMLSELDRKLRAQAEALGKILAQVQPLPEESPTAGQPDNGWAERKAESDRLGNEVIARLEAEDQARQHAEGKV